jgi:hypothetical protein
MKKRMKMVMPTKRPNYFQYQFHKLIKWLWYKLTGYTYFDVYYGTQKHIHFGKGVAIAPGVKIVASNPCVDDVWARTTPEETYIGDYCYIGSNSVILPGVRLGSHVIVSANSVVKAGKYYSYCILAGNPAKKVKDLNPEECGEFYFGYNKEKGLK